MEFLVILIVLLLIFGGGAYSQRGIWGQYYNGPAGIFGAVILLLLCILIARLLAAPGIW